MMSFLLFSSYVYYQVKRVHNQLIVEWNIKIVHIPVNKERKLNIIKWSIKFQLFKLNFFKKQKKKC